MQNFNAVALSVCPAERAHPDRQTDILVKTEEHLSTKVAALRAERVRASRAQR